MTTQHAVQQVRSALIDALRSAGVPAESAEAAAEDALDLAQQYGVDVPMPSGSVTKVEDSASDVEATERLMHYWAEGEGAAKIRWGEPDDFYRCEAHLGKYVHDRHKLQGLCANLHHRAIGVWPGQEDHKSADLDLAKVGPKGYVHGWIYVGPEADRNLSPAQAVNRATEETGESFDSRFPEDVPRAVAAVKATGHARLSGQGPQAQKRAEAVRSALEEQGVHAKVHPITVHGEKQLRVFDPGRRTATPGVGRPEGADAGPKALAKFDPGQPRDAHGRWSAVAGAVEHAFKPITAREARGNSRGVSAGEFQRLATVGETRLDDMQKHASPPTGLDEHWDRIKHESYSEASKPWGGATIDAHTGKPVESHARKFALTIKPPTLDSVSMDEHAPRSEFDAKMDEARRRFGDELTMQGAHLGVFHDDDNHRIDIDPVLVVDSLDDVESIGAATHAVGGAYCFQDGNGYWPPHVAEQATKRAGGTVHFKGPGEWRSRAVEAQREQGE